jgi:hypothetical protein
VIQQLVKQLGFTVNWRLYEVLGPMYRNVSSTILTTLILVASLLLPVSQASRFLRNSAVLIAI